MLQPVSLRQFLSRCGIAWLLLLLVADVTADDRRANDAADLAWFEAHVRPILADHCAKCHGPVRQWSGLRMDSREALLKGGDRGPAVIPGNARGSLLIQAVRHSDDLKMPEQGRLTEAQIAVLERWIERGVAFPTRGIPSSKAPGDHWAFQPLSSASVPEVRETGASDSPVDRFLQAPRDAQSLAASGPADLRTLLRRITFDLTGLPPTPQEVEEFLSDTRPDAFERVIDRLLASPAYGEHWGRHWLDVARYADSNGLDENIAHGNAWRYRDAIVAAFNADTPIDQFLIEQLAGDLLPFDSESRQHSQLIATGFLSLGPKVLAEVDQPKMRMDIVDEQIDTVGRVFLGLTLGCARCHDHKFDPVSTHDYYGLAGIFKSTRTMDSYTKVARWHEHLLPSATATALQKAFDDDIAARKRQIEERVEAANRAARDSVPAGSPVPESLESLYPEATKAELAKLREQLASQEKAGPDLPSTMGVTDDEIADVPVHVRGDPLKLGPVVPRHTLSIIATLPPPVFTAGQSGRLELARWLVDPRHPLTSRVFVNRVWRWHFGRGLVRTTDNFGLQSPPPSHPELLDWLARRFMAERWSLKSLHRQLVASRTFRQSGDPVPETLAADPDNRCYGWFPRRRLAAEEIRDALLAVSGQLDPTPGGPVLKVKNRGYLFDHTSIDQTDYTSVRRSIYLPVIRNHVFDFFQLLDFPDPAQATGDRATSTVAPQALLMMNSDFVMHRADAVAQRILAGTKTQDESLRRLFLVIFGREATSVELERAARDLSRLNEALQAVESNAGRRDVQAWAALSQMLLATNEFLYVK